MNPSRARYAIRGALCVLFALAGPLAAQTTNTATTNNAAAAPASGNDVVGPRELQNFSLGGTVTRQAEPAAPSSPAATRATPPTASPRNSADRQAAPEPVRPEPREAVSRPSRQADPAPAQQVVAGNPVFADPAPSVAPADVASPAEADLLPDQDTPSLWPWWLAAAVVVAGAGLLLWRRRQRHDEPAVAGLAHGFVASESAPAPIPQARQAAPAPRRPLDDGGIVSRGLQPKIAFEFKPLRAELDAGGTAAMNFEVVVVNSGSAPARNVLVEALMVSAGPEQDAEIAHFFRNPVGRGERLPLIPPMGRVTLRTRAMLPPERQSPIEVEGRKLLVPLVALNALYRGGSGESQSSASYLVGRGGGDGKMGPLRLDRGARAWTDLGVRPHSAGLQQ